MCVRACCVCVRAVRACGACVRCVRACVHAVRACVRACVRAGALSDEQSYTCVSVFMLRYLYSYDMQAIIIIRLCRFVVGLLGAPVE